MSLVMCRTGNHSAGVIAVRAALMTDTNSSLLNWPPWGSRLIRLCKRRHTYLFMSSTYLICLHVFYLYMDITGTLCMQWQAFSS